MDLLLWAIIVIVVALASAFNYYLNLAPGADPEDFQVGPRQLGITCDCSLNVIIIGGILILALSTISGSFDSRIQLYSVGIISFILITSAGIMGRRRRHQEWRELQRAIERSVPASSIFSYGSTQLDIVYDDEEDDDDYDYDDY
ncbi:MAG: hypothetical protein ACFFFK_04280 [Candidatus Thorarchaeota archaeon]